MTHRTPEFSFSDLDLFQALLASSSPLEAEPVSEERLVRYAFGWSTEADEDGVLDALTQSSFLRQDLIQIRGSLAQPEARSRCVKEFLDYAISSAVGALGALERGMADWKSSFEGNLVVQHVLAARSERLASLPGPVAWARSAAEEEPIAVDSLLVDTDFGATTSVPLSGGPSARDGELELEVEFDSHFFSEYAEQTLELSFTAGPLVIPLRAWKVSELPKNGLLSAPIPSSLVGAVPRTAIGLSLYATV